MKTTRGLTNIFIDKILHNRAQWYIGTYSANNIPSTKQKIISFVCNLSKYKEPGTHFIAIMIDKKNKKAEYFDPYGLQCSNKYILKYLSKYVKRISYSRKQIQHLYSDHCGVHCIAYILSKNKNMSLNTFINLYKNKNLYVNDDISTEFIKNIL